MAIAIVFAERVWTIQIATRVMIPDVRATGRVIFQNEKQDLVYSTLLSMAPAETLGARPSHREGVEFVRLNGLRLRRGR